MVFKRLLARSRVKSPWIYCANSGSCNGCDIEIAACLGPRYDVEQIGTLRQGSPKHADILLVSGPVTLRMKDALLDIYGQIAEPKVVVAVGSCPASGNVFAGSPAVVGALNRVIPVDVFVSGCPPRPQSIIDGCLQAAGILAAMTRPRRTATAGFKTRPGPVQAELRPPAVELEPGSTEERSE